MKIKTSPSVIGLSAAVALYWMYDCATVCPPLSCHGTTVAEREAAFVAEVERDDPHNAEPVIYYFGESSLIEDGILYSHRGERIDAYTDGEVAVSLWRRNESWAVDVRRPVCLRVEGEWYAAGGAPRTPCWEMEP